jgi:RNA polymerase sigma factor (sigma-70 family)
MLTTTDRKKTTETFQSELEALYLENREMVLQAAYKTIRNKEDAEDVLQTVFLRLIEQPELQTGFRSNPKGYLYVAAINEALNVIDARERQRLTDDDIDSFEIPVPEPDSGRDDDIRRVRAAMAIMKPYLVEILNLYYNEGYSCLEIAELRRKAVHAVFMELFRARVELKKAIRIQEKRDERQKEKHERDRGRVFAKTSEA